MSALSRRAFLQESVSRTAQFALAGAIAPAFFRGAGAYRPLGRVVAREPFGRIERIADGVWALVSTPLTGDNTTVSNGGIVAGRDAVLAIEGFNKPDGAQWLAARARELTGRWPTHVVLTHYHADHANGVAGYLTEGERPEIRATQVTRDEVIARNKPADAARTAALEHATFLSTTDAATFDLGGRRIRLVPRRGHTDSDVSLEIDEPSIVFCGDLFWNSMFPNFVDAIPTQLASSVRGLRRERDTVYVPGHGVLGGAPDFDRYASMLEEVERAARRAHQDGVTAAEGASKFTIPASLGAWTLFGPTFFERAFAAWYRELT